MSSALLPHLALYTIGLALVGVVMRIAARLWRSDPILAYSILRGGLVAALLLPAAQWTMHGRSADHAVARAFRTRLDAVLPERPAPEPEPVGPEAAVTTSIAVSEAIPIERASAPSPAAFTLDFIAARPIASPSAGTGPTGDASPPRGPARRSVPPPGELVWWIYLAGLAAVLVHHLSRHARTWWILRRCPPVTSEPLAPAFARALDAFPRLARVRLLVSDRITTPACWGVRNPVIVVPERDVRTPTAAVPWALVHELIHLERRDPLVAILQAALTSIAWFHPAAWRLSRDLDRLRELSCDLLVVKRTGHRRSYALALLDYAERPARIAGASTGSPLARLLHMSPSPPQLRRRIEMLSFSKRPLSNRKRAAIVAGAVAGLSAVWAGQLAIASTFSDAKDLVFARCDGKSKKKPKNQWQQPPAERGPCEPEKAAPAEVDIARLLEDATGPTRIVADQPGAWNAGGVHLDPEIREALIRTLVRDENPSVRMASAHALAPYLDDSTVKAAFLRALRESCDDSRAMLMDVLLQREAISPDVRDLLVGVVSNGKANPIQGSIAEALAPFADRQDARQVLIRALQDHRNAVVQLSAAKALAPHSKDEEIRSAMVAAVMNGRNEVARMVILQSLSDQLVESDQVRELFQVVVQRDDNEVARMTAAQALAARADDAGVRQSMITVLLGERNDVVKMAFADALAPYAHDPAVKRAFIQSIPKLGSDVIRMRMVTALADVVDPSARSFDAAGQHPRSLPRPDANGVIPVGGR